MRCGRRRRSSGSSPTADREWCLTSGRPWERTALLSVAAEARAGRSRHRCRGAAPRPPTARERRLRRHRLHARHGCGVPAQLPDADVRLGDVRDLAEFGADRFSLAVFSYNGLDAVDHGDRARAWPRSAGSGSGCPARLLDHNRPVRASCHPVAPGRVARGTHLVEDLPMLRARPQSSGTRALPRRFVNWHRSRGPERRGEWPSPGRGT